MEAIVLNCPKQGRFHFGLTGLDENASLYQTSAIIHSDTLFSALISLCAKAFPEQVKPLIDAFNQHIRISSAYYCLDIHGDEELIKRIFFLPKPDCLDLKNDDVSIRKPIKKVQFLSKSVWEQGLLPKDWKGEHCHIINGKFVVHQNDMPLKLAKQIEKVFEERTAPKIADHARQRNNNIYFQTDLHLHQSRIKGELPEEDGYREFIVTPSFYLLVKDTLSESDKKLSNLLNLLFELLADEGIGGGISTGCGKLISIEKEAFNIDMEVGKEAVSMSLISPKLTDFATVTYANILTRGGRNISAKETLNRLKMLKEGASITAATEGDIVAIHNSGMFLRYGKAFPLPIHPNYHTS